jgi:serine/threonine protein phosphatase PrpC
MDLFSGSYRRVRSCVKTDIGLTRRNNEDYFLVIDDRDNNYDTLSMGMLFAVAEGRLNILKDVIRRVHLKIPDLSLKGNAYEGMGTTLSALVCLEGAALIAYVGDSRIYRLRYGCLEKLTNDHTLAQLSVEMGYIRPEEAEKHPLRDVSTKYGGSGTERGPDQGGKDYKRGYLSFAHRWIVPYGAGG